MVDRMRRAFGEAARRPWFDALAAPLLISGFAAASAASYGVLLEWDREARADGYEEPA
jgi:hypothetical protein